jgi:hypothetical protein
MRVLIVAAALVAVMASPAVAGRDAPILDRLLAPHGQVADSGSCTYRCQSRYSNCTSNCRTSSCRSSCSARYSSCLTNCTTRN